MKPVAWLEPEWREKICPEVGYEITITDDHPKDLCWIPLYAHPPQGEPVAWVGLTDEQIYEHEWWDEETAFAVNKELKEKNGG